jgi:hypothetical protein
MYVLLDDCERSEGGCQVVNSFLYCFVPLVARTSWKLDVVYFLETLVFIFYFTVFVIIERGDNGEDMCWRN